MMEYAYLKTAEIVKNYKVCQLTSVIDNEKNPGTQYWIPKPRVYEETDSTEVKSKNSDTNICWCL